MADASAVSLVKSQLIDELDDVGLGDPFVSNLLDSGLSTTKATLAAWRAIAAKTVMVEDVSESGSSRTSRLHENAREMVAIWQARSDAEDKAALTDALGRGRFASHRITRV